VHFYLDGLPDEVVHVACFYGEQFSVPKFYDMVMF
jgi:hypothetical protein